MLNTKLSSYLFLQLLLPKTGAVIVKATVETEKQTNAFKPVFIILCVLRWVSHPHTTTRCPQ